MSQIQFTIQKIYYSIKNDLTFEEHPTLEAALNVTNLKYILKRRIGYTPVRTSANTVGYDYAVELMLFNADGQPLDNVIEKDWKLTFSRFGMPNGCGYNTMWVMFTNSFGKAQEEGFDIKPEGFINAYKRLQQLNGLNKAPRYTNNLNQNYSQVKLTSNTEFIN